MFPASPTSSPNLSVKKSILAHKSLIQWSFPVKRVKCYLIECAVSYQRETARPALTIHITRVTCIQVHVNRGWKNLRYFWSIFGFIGFSDLLWKESSSHEITGHQVFKCDPAERGEELSVLSTDKWYSNSCLGSRSACFLLQLWSGELN